MDRKLKLVEDAAPGLHRGVARSGNSLCCSLFPDEWTTAHFE